MPQRLRDVLVRPVLNGFRMAEVDETVIGGIEPGLSGAQSRR
jgi:hypothetical protein